MAKQNENQKNNLSGPNKEIDQMFAAWGTDTTPNIEMPGNKKNWVRVAVLLAVVLVLGGALFWKLQSRTDLYSRLPEDTSFYIYVGLPGSANWYRSLLFWQKDSQPSSDTFRLYRTLNALNVAGADFEKDILPKLTGKLEYAVYGDNRALAIKFSDAEDWQSLLGVTVRDGDIRLLEKEVSGWIEGEENELFWFSEGKTVFISNAPTGIIYERSRKEPRFAGKAGTLKMRGALGGVYLENKDVLAGRQPWLALILDNINLPVALVAREKGGKLYVSTPGGERAALAKADLLTKLAAGNDVALRTADAGAALAFFEEMVTRAEPLTAANLRVITDAASSLYGLDLAVIRESLAKQELIVVSNQEFVNEERYWFAVFPEAESGSAAVGLEVLAGLGEALFAAAHPARVNRTLPDGSTMVELRADTEGLTWESVPWSFAGTEFALGVLRGQGEETGYYLALVPGVGAVASNSHDYLEKILTHFSTEDGHLPLSDTETDGCVSEFAAVSTISLDPAIISLDQFLADSISKIMLSELKDGSITACVEF